LASDIKPSEFKVHSIAKNGAPPVTWSTLPSRIGARSNTKKPIRAGAENGGIQRLRPGRPRRKSKHFEILGLDPACDMVGLHVEWIGSLRKTRAVHEDDPKWATEIKVGRYCVCGSRFPEPRKVFDKVVVYSSWCDRSIKKNTSVIRQLVRGNRNDATANG
jgi:hypothetical protein